MEKLGMKLSFWQGKKVLITGHTGFKGSWLALWLQQLGAEVIGFSLAPPTQPNLFELTDAKKNMISIEGDVRDFNALQKAFTEHNPELIFHMAAQPLVRYSYEQPIETYSTNVMGTVNLLEAARMTGCSKAIINVTSDKCYENKEWHRGYQESDSLGGHDPYSNSKACSELVTSAFRSSFYANAAIPCGLASVRAGNVIGGGDWANDRLIPDLMRSLLNKVPFTVRYPQALRPWQHVLEPLHGYLKLAASLYQFPSDFSQAWNFGPEDADVQPVGWIVNRIQQLWNVALVEHYETGAKLHEASLLKLDSTKAKNGLNWKPNWNLEVALNKTVDWFRAYENGDNMNKTTLAQIDEYTNLIG